MVLTLTASSEVSTCRDNFCLSVCSSFQLIIRNLATSIFMHMISEYLFVIGKVLVAVMTTGVTGLILVYSEPYKTDLNSAIPPSVVIFIMAYILAHIIFV